MSHLKIILENFNTLMKGDQQFLVETRVLYNEGPTLFALNKEKTKFMIWYPIREGLCTQVTYIVHNGSPVYQGYKKVERDISEINKVWQISACNELAWCRDSLRIPEEYFESVKKYCLENNVSPEEFMEHAVTKALKKPMKPVKK